LYSDNTTLRFNNTADATGCISTDGNIQVKAVKLDDVITEKVTYIKMDIEGGELSALEGAQRILKQDRPKLAISLYHKPTDLWEIPIYIKKLVPEYKFYVRHHDVFYGSFVLYAVI
jgi:hypothetical protein